VQKPSNGTHSEANSMTWERMVERISLIATVITWPLLFLSVALWAPDWSYQSDVTAPMTRTLLFFHPPSAWASFVAYLTVFAFGVAYLNERKLHYDAPARAAAEVGFLLNSIALITGTFWGIQEWSRQGQTALATVYTEPKVLVVVVLWAVFAAYLLLRRMVDGAERQARLAAVFGILGFVGVPASFLTSRALETSLHPDIAGPGANPDAAVSGDVGWLLLLGFVAFVSLFLYLWVRRLQLLRLADRLEKLENT